MKKIYIISMAIFVILNGGGVAVAQGYDNDRDPWGGSRSNQDFGYDYIDCAGNSMNAMEASYCAGRYGLESVYHKGQFRNTQGLYGKVAAGVAAQRPRRSSGNSGSGRQKGSVGSYNYQTSDAHRQWLEQKRERDAEARQRAVEKKRYEDMMKKIEDDNRAAAVEAQTNARLQQQTNRAIARDHYNATEGAYKAQQMARKASQMKGPQFAQQKERMSDEYKAGLLRRQNKPRRVMPDTVTYQANRARKPLPQVKRTATMDPERAAMLRKAFAVKAELIRQKRAAGRISGNQARSDREQSRMVNVHGKAMVQLGPHATSTLGKDWNTISLTTPRIPPRETKEKRKMTQEEYHRLIVIEMIDQRELTPEERAYYSNLNLP